MLSYWQNLSLFIMLKHVLINLTKEFNPKNHTQVFIWFKLWKKITLIKHYFMGTKTAKEFRISKVYLTWIKRAVDLMWVYFFLLSWVHERDFTRNKVRLCNFVPLNVLFFWKIELIISWISCLSFFSSKLFYLADYLLHLIQLQQDSAKMWACSFCFNKL